MDKISTIDDPWKLLELMRGYTYSAEKSLAKGSTQGAVITVGYIQSMTKRFREITK